VVDVRAITAHPRFAAWSFEELRLADYASPPLAAAAQPLPPPQLLPPPLPPQRPPPAELSALVTLLRSRSIEWVEEAMREEALACAEWRPVWARALHADASAHDAELPHDLEELVLDYVCQPLPPGLVLWRTHDRKKPAANLLRHRSPGEALAEALAGSLTDLRDFILEFDAALAEECVARAPACASPHPALQVRHLRVRAVPRRPALRRATHVGRRAGLQGGRRALLE
jgi:hypothetical protein